MQVTLIGKNSIQKKVLPRIIVGNYWISDNYGDNEKKLINIEGRNGEWQVVSNDLMKIIDSRYIKITNNKIYVTDKKNEATINRIILKDYSIHFVSMADTNEVFVLYCSPVYEENFAHLNINNYGEISIGSDDTNDIIYKNGLVAKKQARIIFNNGRWMIENIDTRIGTFVNSTPVSRTTRVLLNGDVVFIMGLKIIIMGKSIYINNPFDSVQYNGKFTKIETERYIQDLEVEDDDTEVYPEEKYYSRAPRIINKIECEKVKIDPPPTAQNNEKMPAFLVFGSTISMGLIMVLSMTSSLSGIMKRRWYYKFGSASINNGICYVNNDVIFPNNTEKI